MRKDIFNYVAACQECQQFKYNNAPTSSLMQMHLVNEPWHTIGMDILGPLPTTTRQKRFLLVVVDYFTRWVELFPLKSTTSDDIANILTNEIFSRYGLPKHIVSDNGPQFVSNLFKNLCNMLGIKQNLTANYHPQSNMTERVNRTLKPLISIYAQQRPNSWDNEIQKLAFAIRTAVNDTTGETPAFMMFGRDPRGPLDSLIGETTEEAQPTTSEHRQIQECKNNLINNLRWAYNIVREHSEIEKIKQKENYDQHTTQRQYNEGDLVWVASPAAYIGENSMGGKLQPHYYGPCRLIKQLSPNTFTVCRLSDNVNVGATNTDRIKPYIELNRNNRGTTTTTKDQSAHEKQTETLINNQEARLSDLYLRNVKRNQPPTGNNSSQRRVSDRQRRVPMRYIEN
ncbi:unnamed protein product [Rotaria magnacalcarata]|uniref:Integrase catalytic domain-containing protein n=3 Tax=Rotaria magnacalcarata TaxID=392030 RepID=A0A816PVL7_9BILA|nr:unnamed protein product [Rotaria magnacalcarata]